MKVLMITNYLPPDYGGGGLQMMRLAEVLSERGAQCLILASTKNRSLWGFSREPVPAVRFVAVGRNRVRNFLFFTQVFLYVLFNGHKYDVLHMTCINWGGMAATLIMKALGKKCLMKFSLQGVDDPASIRKSAMGGLKLAILKKLDYYVSTSQDVFEQAKKETPEFASKMILLPNGVDTKEFRPRTEEEKKQLRAQLDLPADEFIFCFTGIISHRKGIDVLFEAWAQWVKRSPRPGVLMLIGPMGVGLNPFADPAYEKKLLEFVQTSGIEKTLSFTGRTDRVADYLGASDAFLFPARREGLPNALIEAQACGLPAVASNIEGNRDVIENNRNGFLFDLKNINLFVECIEKLHGDPKLCAAMGGEAREMAVDRYSMDTIAACYEKMYGMKAEA